MSDRKPHKRSAPISYRPPENLRAELAARQARSGLSMNAYITKALFGVQPLRGSRRPMLESGDLARLLAQIALLHDRLVAVADAAMLDELAIIRAGLLKAMEHAP